MAPENLFAGAYLDRRAEARLREEWLAEARDDAHTIYIGMRAGRRAGPPGRSATQRRGWPSCPAPIRA